MDYKPYTVKPLNDAEERKTQAAARDLGGSDPAGMAPWLQLNRVDSVLNTSITEGIKYLQAPDLLDPLNNDIDYRQLIIWLENRIIRKYKIEEREALSNIKIPLGEWKQTFKKYLEDLEAEKTVIECLNEDSIIRETWQGVCLKYLLDMAVEYADEDKAEEKRECMDVDSSSPTGYFAQCSKRLSRHMTEAVRTRHISGPSENFDPKTENVIKNLAEFLKIPMQFLQRDEKILEACKNVVENHFNNRNLINDMYSTSNSLSFDSNLSTEPVNPSDLYTIDLDPELRKITIDNMIQKISSTNINKLVERSYFDQMIGYFKGGSEKCLGSENHFRNNFKEVKTKQFRRLINLKKKSTVSDFKRLAKDHPFFQCFMGTGYRLKTKREIDEKIFRLLKSHKEDNLEIEDKIIRIMRDNSVIYYQYIYNNHIKYFWSKQDFKFENYFFESKRTCIKEFIKLSDNKRHTNNVLMYDIDSYYKLLETTALLFESHKIDTSDFTKLFKKVEELKIKTGDKNFNGLTPDEEKKFLLTNLVYSLEKEDSLIFGEETNFLSTIIKNLYELKKSEMESENPEIKISNDAKQRLLEDVHHTIFIMLNPNGKGRPYWFAYVFQLISFLFNRLKHVEEIFDDLTVREVLGIKKSTPTEIKRRQLLTIFIKLFPELFFKLWYLSVTFPDSIISGKEDIDHGFNKNIKKFRSETDTISNYKATDKCLFTMDLAKMQIRKMRSSPDKPKIQTVSNLKDVVKQMEGIALDNNDISKMAERILNLQDFKT